MAKDDAFQKGWEAALEAVSAWHAAQAKQAIVLSGRTRFPKNLEREAALHTKCAERVRMLTPED